MPVNYLTKAKVWRPLILIIFLLAVIILLRLSGVADKLTAVREWINGLGSWEPLVFVLVYILAVVLALPGSAITIAGSYSFRFILGSNTSKYSRHDRSKHMFSVSRYLARDFIVRKFGQNEKFIKLDRLTEEHGAIVVAITRLIPLFPFNVLNYGFGLTGVPFRTYVFWSWLCMLPGTILYVVGTDIILSGVSEGKIPWLLVLVLLLIVITLAFLAFWARKKLSGSKDKSI